MTGPVWRHEDDQAGVTTAEYVAVLGIVALLVGLLTAGPLAGSLGRPIELAMSCIRSDGAGCGGGAPGDPGGSAGGEDGDDRDGASAAGGLASAVEELPEGTTIRDGNGDVLWESGDGLTGDADVDAALQALVDIREYLEETFGWDSFDDGGAGLIMTLDDSASIDNAFWDGRETRYGPGMATPDVIAHEFGHAHDQHTSDLDHTGSLETASLSESVADMFASNVTDDWEIGEDSAIGTIRDMSEQAHVDDYDSSASSGHANAVITNHAYYEMVDGVGGLGRDVGEQVLHRAMTDHLDSDADLADFRDAMLTSAQELYGPDSDELAGVRAGLDDVGLDEDFDGP